MSDKALLFRNVQTDFSFFQAHNAQHNLLFLKGKWPQKTVQEKIEDPLPLQIGQKDLL